MEVNRQACKDSSGGVQPSKERDSNLELLRIIAMFLIVAHHSVVNSGITDNFSFIELTPNMIFLQLWGMWGKTAINVFVMITGYFMCTSKLTWRRFAKMYLETKFYTIVIAIFFSIVRYEPLSLEGILRLLFGNIREVNIYFIGSFLAFYMFIPFMNTMIEKLGSNLWKLVLSLLGMFMVVGTFFFNAAVFSHVSWYATLYFTAAWFRLYPDRYTESRRFIGLVLLVAVLLSYASVVAIDALEHAVGAERGWACSYYLVADSNKLLAFFVGTSAFLFFKNLRMRQSRLVNRVAATTFGVLCIHANSDTMRRWLWRDLLDIPSMYAWSLPKLIVAEMLIAAGVFAICSALDMLRIRYIERPLLAWLDKNTEMVENRLKKFLFIGKRILEKAEKMFIRLT